MEPQKYIQSNLESQLLVHNVQTPAVCYPTKHFIWLTACDRETKSGSFCLHKLNFLWHSKMLHLIPWCLRHIQDSRLAGFAWVLVAGFVFNWHSLKLLKLNLQEFLPCKKSIPK